MSKEVIEAVVAIVASGAIGYAIKAYNKPHTKVQAPEPIRTQPVPPPPTASIHVMEAPTQVDHQVCSFCGKLVARYELANNIVKCANCIAENK